jgi:CCR4-NOT transcription complex subunit 3
MVTNTAQQMEKFKAVEKAMKTKAYSKEGLSAAAKLDPKERAKLEACEFLSNMVDELERQIETLEAEGEQIQATMKKGKNQSTKADRMAEIERITERHKWHQGKLELIKRSLENGGLETEQVTDLEESIKYYVTDGTNEDFMEDDEMYDDLNLEEEEDAYGMNNDNDRVSSQDTQSIQEEGPDTDGRLGSIPGVKPKAATAPEAPVVTARRPSTQLKSPLPALATLHTPLSNMTNGSSSTSMKPATVPTRPPGETLKYASAAAAAASVGIAPLPPPPGATPPSSTTIPLAPLPPPPKQLSSESPVSAAAQPASSSHTPAQRASIPATATIPDPLPATTQSKSPALSQPTAAPSGNAFNSIPPTPVVERADSTRPGPSRTPSAQTTPQPAAAESSKGLYSSATMLFTITKFTYSFSSKAEWHLKWLQG